MCLTSMKKGRSVACCEWSGRPPWLSSSGKSDHVLRET